MSFIVKNTFLHAVKETPSLQRAKSAPLSILVSEGVVSSPPSPSGSIWSSNHRTSTGSEMTAPCSPPAATGRLTKFAKQKDSVSHEKFTTVMIQNVPCKYTQDELIEDIAELTALYNFVYLPPSKRCEGNVGYAFVNFATPAAAQYFMTHFTGFTFPKIPTSRKVACVRFGVLQGLRENIKFYKKSKVSRTSNAPYINREL